MTRDPDEAPARRGDAWTQASVIAVLALCGFQVWWGLRMRDEIDALRAAATRMEAAAAAAAAKPADTGSDVVGQRLEAMQADMDVLTGDIGRLNRNIADLTASLEQRGMASDEPAQPPEVDWSQPDLWEVARKSADSVGIALTKDEVRVPARIAIREGPLEYFAVLKGGKEHESLLSLVGNTLPDARRPRDLGVKLNIAIQALGYKRGRPIKFTPTGTKPAEGERIRLYVEWTSGGKKEVARAEDLVWNRSEGHAMSRDPWVYVGSSFVPGDEAGTMDFAADLTAEAVATYSAPNTIIDNVEPGAQDDSMFVAATPRIPEDAKDVVLILRRTELADAKVFPPVPVKSADK